MDTLFISDIHLSEDRPDQLACFQTLLRGPARQAKALYILGDLFENFWLGNDDSIPPNPEIISELLDFSNNGHSLFLIRGNRDLILDSGIEKLTGGTLLPDLSVIDLDNERVLIAHGDVLCTKDIKYQLYRRFMELGFIKWLFLNFPLWLRLFLVRGIRPLMQKSVQNKRPEIIDVDPDAVVKTMRKYGVQVLIHGHTHRPAIHRFDIDGKPATRIVLGDWYAEDSVLVCSKGEKKLMRIQDYINSLAQ